LEKHREDAVQNTWIRGKAWLGAVAACSFLSLDAYGQSYNKTSLTLTGKVAEICKLEITAKDNTNIKLDKRNGDSNKLVGTVEEICNTSYSVTMVTQNGQAKNKNSGLLMSVIANDEYAYQVKYGGSSTPVAISNGVAEVTPLTDASIDKSGNGIEKDVKISYSQATRLVSAADYKDTLIFTIRAHN